MESNLKPCPFCGGTNLGFSSKTVARKYGSCRAYHGAIYCKKCNAYGARVLSETIKNVYPMPDVDFDELERRAVEAWNRRTPEIVKIETNIYDKEEIYHDCTVQVLTNTATGETSVGWWKNGN